MMKKRFKKILLFAIVILSIVCIYPIGVNAISGEISYTDINDVKNLDVRDLSFSNIRFEDYSDTSTMAFGLTGEVVNNSNSSITYSSRVSYYDKDYNLITEAGSSNIALTGSNQFNLMFNLDILGEYSIDDIKYYSLLVSINDDVVSSSSNVPSENSMYASYDYVIDNYDVNIVVNSNNTFDITETITAYFNTPKHGIFRTIPLSNKLVRLDGSTSTNRTQVTNLSVNDEYSTSRENGNYKIQIGSASTTLTGKKTYTIKYTYNLGKDPVKDYDELYYNIIGSEWDTVIGNVTFNITMPKEFDASKLGFSKGEVGSTNNYGINYTVNGNTISGSYDGVLNRGEALTVRCKLPEGYFVDAEIPLDINNFIIYIIPFIFLGISILIWYKKGKDKKVIDTVEFYPPKGFNSLEIGFLYKGNANNKDVISLLIYLANKGYIKILENNSNPLETNNFKIIKLKDYDENNMNESIFLDELFKLGTINDNNVIEVTSKELYNHFYTTINKIKNNINSKENRDRIFEKKGVIYKIIIITMIIITFLIMTVPPVINTWEDPLILLILLLPITIGGICSPFSIAKYGSVIVGNTPVNSKKARYLTASIIAIIFTIPYIIVMGTALKDNIIFSIGFFMDLIPLIGMIICFLYLPKRTDFGNEMLSKIIRFKNFLEIAEKDNLEDQVSKNPTYFYDILPYTYIFEISDKWIKKFEMISISPPSWYDSSTAFNVSIFSNFMNNTMNNAERVMLYSSTSSSSSGVSSSGGGSSGGGSGGGGGGSW